MNTSSILQSIAREIDAKSDVRSVLQVLDDAKRPLSRQLERRTGSAVAAQALTLKVLNLCLGRFHFRNQSSILRSRPYGLEVDPVNNCNLMCPGCVHSSHSRTNHLFDWTSGMLSPERFFAFLDRYGPYALQLTLCNYGEPLLNPNTPGFIRLAKNYLLLTTLSTNMTSPRFDAEAYAASGLDFMTVSLDGATQAVYERFRKRGNLDLALGNIRRLVEAKRQLGKQTPFISWQFLAFEHNVHEIDAAVRIAREIGVDQLRVATPFDVSWDDPAIKPAGIQPVTHEFRLGAERPFAENWNPFGCESAKAAIHREFESQWAGQAGSSLETDAVLANGEPRHICHWLYKNLVMDATGRIIPCCAAPQPNIGLVFGSFPETADDPFNSVQYRLARLSFSDKAAYAREAAAAALSHAPHCVTCDWYSDQQAAQIDSAQVRNYLKSAGYKLFDPAALTHLSDW